jgi:hypothetical protein
MTPVMSGCKAIVPLLFAATMFGDPLFERVRELPPAHLGEKYTAVLQAGLPGNCSIPGVHWQVAAGQLPAGVTLAGGRLQGTPRAAGGWQVALRASSACSDVIVPVRVMVSGPDYGVAAAAPKTDRPADGS